MLIHLNRSSHQNYRNITIKTQKIKYISFVKMILNSLIMNFNEKKL